MSPPTPFADLLRRVRLGDEQAAEELVRRYEPVIRSTVRVRMGDPAIKRVFDSLDICQSVLASFFTRAALGQFEIDDPDQLVALLIRMAQNKLAHQVRRYHQQRRDVRRLEPGGAEHLDALPGDPDASRIASGRDLLAELRKRLDDEARELADRRGQGQTWAQIATDLGGTAQARRKQLGRAINRIAAQLGLDEDDPDV